MISIGVQGDIGSFSEQAGKFFAEKQKIGDYKIEYLISSEGVLDAIEKGTVDIGIFAIENSQGGVVIESIEALAVHRCDIIEMFQILIEQNLLVLPGKSIGDIKAIHSHQQALSQCREYLEKHFKNHPQIEETDTAKAACDLKAGKLPESAAVIANKTCAELYGLEVLQASIQDMKENLTMFIAIKRFKK